MEAIPSQDLKVREETIQRSAQPRVIQQHCSRQTLDEDKIVKCYKWTASHGLQRLDSHRFDKVMRRLEVWQSMAGGVYWFVGSRIYEHSHPHFTRGLDVAAPYGARPCAPDSSTINAEILPSREA